MRLPSKSPALLCLYHIKKGMQKGHKTNDASFREPGNFTENQLSSLAPPRNTGILTINFDNFGIHIFRIYLIFFFEVIALSISLIYMSQVILLYSDHPSNRKREGKCIYYKNYIH